jgi:flagellin
MIYSNITAMNALYDIQNVTSQINKASEELSTGFQINSPSDDPSGYVIANELQTQLNGMNQALSNTQGATNLVKTATGGLTQISTLLDSIQSAAQDAANVVNTDPNQAAADQATIQTAIQGINAITGSTQYGNQYLLNGSAGTSAAVTNGTDVAGISFGGNFGGGVTQSGNVTVTVTQAATYAQSFGGTHATYASVNSLLSTVNGGTTGTGGTVYINGQGITVQGSTTVQTLINDINSASSTTGVTANYSSGNGSVSINLSQTTAGSQYSIVESETGALINGTSGANVSGLNAVATVQATALVNGTAQAETETFTGGQMPGDSGLRLTDSNGNSILLTGAGNSTTTSNVAVGQITSNALQFQIGANAGETASLAIGNVSASNLGTSVFSGQSISTLNVTSQTGANNALQIVQAAMNQVDLENANLGGFQNNVLGSATSVLNTGITNISTAVGDIVNANIPEVTAQLSNLQAIQQQGVAALKVADGMPSLFLSLLS